MRGPINIPRTPQGYPVIVQAGASEQGQDMANNCRRLWPLIYGREIDPRVEIIAPALAIRKAGYGEPTRDYKQELRDALKE